MLLVVWLFAAAAMLELVVWLLPAQVRRLAAALVIPVLLGTALVTGISHPSVFSAILAVLVLYRACNMLRTAVTRMHEQYLRRLGFQCTVWTIGMQAAVILLWSASVRFGASPEDMALLLTSGSLTAAVVMFLSVLRHVRMARPPRYDHMALADHELPTLTVAIPARNETEDLEQCLQSLVASTYPKLEVLVLDDCSQNKRTPEIIRSFAHDGVRFIPGVEPADAWLAKNFAYQRLYEEANGELILFCGVDARFEPNSLRLLVTALLQKRKSMMSVMPKNRVPSIFAGGSSSLVQPMRYAWEIALPRRMLRRPPVLSTCWLVRRELIQTAGGFAAVGRSIVPESYFARVSAVHDGYTFIRSNEEIGIVSNKSFTEQQSTMVRVRYPQVHRRIELVALLTFAEIGSFIVPYVYVVAGLLGYGPHTLLLISSAAVMVLTAMYSMVVAITYRAILGRSLLLLPIAGLLDIVLLNYSMLRYEFFTVTWKGRNVCIPVMRVVDQLEMSDDTVSHAQQV